MRSFILLLLVSVTTVQAQTPADSLAILNTLESWNKGWAEANADLAVQSYADDVDWTNAFGDRFQGKEALKKGLAFILSLEFVMAGNTEANEYTDIRFLTPDIAILRSKLVRVGQQRSSGETMENRHINHLRVLERRNGKWQIVSHLISQAHEKR